MTRESFHEALERIEFDLLTQGELASASVQRAVEALIGSNEQLALDVIEGDDEIDELFGLKMGADDFIKKPFSQRLLVERVRAVLRRSQPRDGSAQRTTEQSRILERGALTMDQERHTCTWKGLQVTLTVTEFLILYALAHRPGVVKSRNALMDAAYDDQVYVDDRTIDSHIKRLRKKFKQVDNDFDMIETLYGVGYRFKEV